MNLLKRYALVLLAVLFVIACGAAQESGSTPSAPASDEDKADSDRLMEDAYFQQASGELGIALELASQARAKWKDNPRISAFLKEVQPQASAVAKVAQAEATTQAKSKASEDAKLAANAKAEATALAKIGKVGQRRENDGVVVLVNSVSKVGKQGQFLVAGAGKTILVIDVTIECSNRESCSYNTLYFKLKDNESIEYMANLVGLMGDDRAMKSGELARTEKVRGTVSFEVPLSSKGHVLSFQPLVIFGSREPIRIALD